MTGLYSKMYLFEYVHRFAYHQVSVEHPLRRVIFIYRIFHYSPYSIKFESEIPPILTVGSSDDAFTKSGFRNWKNATGEANMLTRGFIRFRQNVFIHSNQQRQSTCN